MRTRVTVLSLCVCVCVCYQFADSISSLYNVFSMAIGFSLGVLDIQLTDLSKMPSFLRKSAFHGYFVVSNPHKRLCILLVVERSRETRSFYLEHTFVIDGAHLAWLTRILILVDRIAIAAFSIYLYFQSKFLLSCMKSVAS